MLSCVPPAAEWGMSRGMNAAEVLADLKRAFSDFEVTPEQQVFLIELYLGTELRELPATLGWTATRVESIRRSLEPDRKTGKALRRRFEPYRPKKLAKNLS
jgi:hypothetical protein